MSRLWRVEAGSVFVLISPFVLLVKLLRRRSMRALRWILVATMLCSVLAAPRLLPLRVQHARIAMTRIGVRLIYADFGA